MWLAEEVKAAVLKIILNLKTNHVTPIIREEEEKVTAMNHA